MPLAHASPRRRGGAVAALATALVLATTLTGCSAGGDPRAEEGRDRSSGSRRTAAEVSVRTTVARVHGELPAAERRRLEQSTGRLLSRYLSAAYLHRRAGAGHRGSFPGFTPDARRLALQDVATTSDAAFTWADQVRPVGAVAFLSVVSPEGRPAGATARMLLKLEASDDRRVREVTVRGRLLLTPTGKRWQIFGYDLSVGSEPTRKGAR